MKLSVYWFPAPHAHLSFSVCLTIWLSSSPLCSLYSSLCQILSPTLWILTPHLVMMCLSDLTVWSSLLLRSSSYQDCSTHSSQPLGLLISVSQAHLSPVIIFLTDSYDPALKYHCFSFPVLVVYWSVFSQDTLLSHGCCHSSQSISIMVNSVPHDQSLEFLLMVNYSHPLSWVSTPNHLVSPVPVLVVSEKWTQVVVPQSHVLKSLMCDYIPDLTFHIPDWWWPTAGCWWPTPWLLVTNIVRLRNWTPWSWVSTLRIRLRYTHAHNLNTTQVPRLRLEPWHPTNSDSNHDTLLTYLNPTSKTLVVYINPSRGSLALFTW